MARKLSILLILFSVSCSENFLEFSADKTSTESLLFKMREYLDDFDYTNALATFNSMSSSQQSTREARELYASTYMGSCGIEFISFVNDISNGSGNLFSLLLEAMPGASATTVNNCSIAEGIIDENISNLTPQTVDYNMSLLNGLGEVGAVLNFRAADASDVLNPAFDPCNVGDLPDANVQQIVSSLTRVLSYTSESTLSFFGSALDGVCDTGQPLELAGLCTPVDESAVTASQICITRALIKEGSAIGLNTGACGGGDITTCNCLPGCPF